MNFVISGCVKNCEKYLDTVFQNIKKIMEKINVVKIIISFDKSEDKSLDKLVEIQKSFKNNVMDILINTNYSPTSYRTVNIANARNNILSYLNQINDIKIDYFIMMDFDDICCSPINITVLEEVIKDNTWDCLTFYNEKYYDFWALSIGNYVYSCWHWSNPEKIISIISDYLKEKIKNCESKLLECDSAFGGFGIYKYEKFKNIKYDPLMDVSLIDINKVITVMNETSIKAQLPFNGLSYFDCEHRTFHMNAKKNGAKIFIYKDPLFSPFGTFHAEFLYKEEKEENSKSSLS